MIANRWVSLVARWLKTAIGVWMIYMWWGCWLRIIVVVCIFRSCRKESNSFPKVKKQQQYWSCLFILKLCDCESVLWVIFFFLVPIHLIWCKLKHHSLLFSTLLFSLLPFIESIIAASFISFSFSYIISFFIFLFLFLLFFPLFWFFFHLSLSFLFYFSFLVPFF